MSEFTFNLSEIGDDGKDYSWPVADPWIGQHLASVELRADPEATPGQLDLHVQKNGSELLLQGRLTVELLAPCVRCLEDAPFSVATDMVGLLRVPEDPRAAGRSAPEMVDDDDQYLDPGALVGDRVRLDDWVCEHIVVEFPMRHLCGDDCNGLEVPAHIRPPEDFGDDRSGVDPRLLPLLELKDKVLPNKE